MSQRWCIASGLITLLLSGCTIPKSPQDIYKLTKASIILITAYTKEPSTGTGFFIEGEKGVCTVLQGATSAPKGRCLHSFTGFAAAPNTELIDNETGRVRKAGYQSYPVYGKKERSYR